MYFSKAFDSAGQVITSQVQELKDFPKHQV